MGDPFSLAAGIAGLISLTLEITKTTRQYVRGVRRASKEVLELLQELAALAYVLRQLDVFLKSDGVGNPNFNQTSVLFQTYNACEKELKEIGLKLQKRRSDHKLFQALKWPLVGQEHQQFLGAIRRSAQTFQIALTIDGCQLLAKKAKDVSSVLRFQVQTLDQTKKLSEAVPALQQGTKELATWMKLVLTSVESFSETKDDVFNIKENVKVLTRLALVARSSHAEYATAKSCSRDKQKVLEWLSPLDFKPKQQDTFGRRSPLTGEWLFENKLYQSWLQGIGPRYMWCSGIPGAGKTVLASVIIDYLICNPPASHTVVAYIYFDYKDKDTHNVSAVSYSILRQLLEYIDRIPQSIQQFYDSPNRERKGDHMSVDQCVSIIQAVCRNMDRVFLVFDALDECPIHDDRANELRSKMIALIRRMSDSMTICVTSRPHLALTHELDDCACLEVRATDGDMRAYLNARMSDHKILRKILDQNPILENHLAETICSKANGMFLLARLQMDSLVHQTSARSIYRALKHLPEKLSDTFHDAMERTAAQPTEHSLLANQVISWIFYAKRPLQVAELREALAVEEGDTRLDRSGCPEVQLSINVCCGLVVIDEQDGVIRFVHYSFQQYLEVCWDLNCPRSREGIATICLTYLMLNDFSPEATETPDWPITTVTNSSLSAGSQWQASHRFLSYVASYWAEHVRGPLEKDLEPLILRYFDMKVHMLYGIQQYNRLVIRNLDYDCWPYEPSPLHITAYWGLHHITEVLIDRGADISMEDSEKRTPLVCAALGGHGKVACLLLGYGAEVDARDSSAATPLHAAVINDHLDIAKLLLESGADANTQNKIGFSPMCIAASNGSLSMMDLLLRHGASVNKINKSRGFSPLEIASRGGHATAVQWLLMKGNDASLKDTFPLIEAVLANKPHIIRILLDTNAKVNAINDMGLTALGAAVKKNDVDMVRRLIAAGADANQRKTGLSETPLQMAAFQGNEALVSLLIHHEANVYDQGGDLGTVLQAAIYSRNSVIVRMILDNFPDVNLGADIYGTTPLHLAVLSKEISILSQLLRHRSDPNQTNGLANPNVFSSFGTTPLHHAVYMGWGPGIDALMSNNADPWLPDLYGRSCIYWAHKDSNLMRRLGGHRLKYKPTLNASHQLHLWKSIQDRIAALQKESDRRGGRNQNYHYLGHCLLRVGDVEEARTSFEQQITNVFSKHEPKHNIICGRCDNDIVGSRFVCYTCADIDLCGDDMRNYERSTILGPPCEGHSFLKVPGPKWEDFGSSQVNARGETIDEWLEQLRHKYSRS